MNYSFNENFLKKETPALDSGSYIDNKARLTKMVIYK